MKTVHFFRTNVMTGTMCGHHEQNEDISKVNENVTCARCLCQMDEEKIKIPQWQIDRFVYGMPESECPNPNAKK